MIKKFIVIGFIAFSLIASKCNNSAVSMLSVPCVEERAGWLCKTLTVKDEANQDRLMEIRWNRVSGPTPENSVIFVKGGSVDDWISFATPTAEALENELDVVYHIRSIEFRFSDGGLQMSQYAKGFPFNAGVYTEVLKWLHDFGIVNKLIHHGNSSGATLVAAALAQHSAESLLSGLVIGGGPFWSDLHNSCAWPTTLERTIIDGFNWPELNTPCTLTYSAPEPAITAQSILACSAAKDKSYSIPIIILLGADDPLDWIAEEAIEYKNALMLEDPNNQISVITVPNTPHLVISTTEGANAIKAGILSIFNLQIQ